MLTSDMEELARRGQEFYDTHLRPAMEATHHGEFLAIEPSSGDYFLAPTLDAAFDAAHAAHTDRPAYVLRVGYRATFGIGVLPMIVGTVDAQGRPLVPLVIFHPSAGTHVTVEAWVDTGFTGHLILPQKLATNLGLPYLGPTPGIVAGGTLVSFAAYECTIEWFRARQTLKVMASGDPLPLLGAELMKGCCLTVAYDQSSVTLVRSASGKPVP